MAITEIITVVLADDHDIVMDALDSLMTGIADDLNFKYHLAGMARNGLEAIVAVKKHTPDLIFLDITMPLASGVEIIHDIRHWSQKTKIIVFTGITAPGLLAEIVEKGVDGLFSKSSDPRLIRDKVPLIIRGAHYIAPEMIDLIDQGQHVANLTSRERQVLNRIISGLSNKQIADELCISHKTVDKHRTSLMNKLGVHSVAQLVSRALVDGLVDTNH